VVHVRSDLERDDSALDSSLVALGIYMCPGKINVDAGKYQSPKSV
jgi:hypothetical protein